MILKSKYLDIFPLFSNSAIPLNSTPSTPYIQYISMAYRVGRYAGRHTLYDELDPAVAAARRAFASPVNEDERLAQWALLKEAEDRRVEEIRKRSVQAVEYSELVEATLTSPKCGSQACWCLTNEGPQHSQGYHIQNEMPVSLQFLFPPPTVSAAICGEGGYRGLTRALLSS